MIRKSDMPFKAASGMTYDSGDFPGVLKQALEMRRLQRLQASASARARSAASCAASASAAISKSPPRRRKEMGGIRFEPTARVTIVTGTLDYGQGHATPIAQVLSDKLGVPFERIRLLQGDSDELVAGGGTGGSRSMMLGGTAHRAKPPTR